MEAHASARHLTARDVRPWRQQKTIAKRLKKRAEASRKKEFAYITTQIDTIPQRKRMK